MSRRRKNSNSGKEKDIYDIIAYTIIYGLISEEKTAIAEKKKISMILSLTQLYTV